MVTLKYTAIIVNIYEIMETRPRGFVNDENN